MNDKIKQLIKDESEKLSQETREVIASSNWENITDEISKKYSLDNEDSENLQVETFLVLAGIELWSSFGRNIQENTDVPHETADKIAGEITERIFDPITSKKFEEIKSDIQKNPPTWEQTVNFVLSGGDYSVYLDKPRPVDQRPDPNYKIRVSRVDGLKNKFNN